jgi:flagellar biosynthetic protein FlhB
LAEEADKDQKSEAPTERRRTQAREDGDLLTSRELATALLGLAGAIWLLAFGPVLAASARLAAADAFRLDRAAIDLFEPVAALYGLLLAVAWPLAALGGLTLLATVLGRAAVGGLVLAPKLLAPRPDRLDPVKGLGRMFGRRGFMELLKALAKAMLILGVGAVLLWRDLPLLLGLGRLPVEAALPALLRAAVDLFLILSVGLSVIAAGDLPVQFLEWLQRLRMTRTEIREEMKQSEGSPEVRAALRRAQHRLLKEANRRAVAEASVVLTNPAHFAVALRYRPGADAAPVVVARGRGPVAAAIRSLAAEHGVMTLSYPEVARALYFTGRVGQMIRADLYVAVATILAFVLRVNEGRPADLPDVEVPDAARFDADGRKMG